VVFTSDHGDLLGAHGDLHQKWYMAYDEAVHVPLIISNPRLFPEPQSTHTLTGHTDLLPTLLGLAGLDAWSGSGNLDRRRLQLGGSAEPYRMRDYPAGR
jgi:arylsulfatase A-like enzyme